MTDFVKHLTRQAAFSRATFGPEPRTKGISEHIGKELEEVDKCYHSAPTAKTYDDNARAAQHLAAAKEWTDVTILGMDGLLRAISAARPGWPFDKVAAFAVRLIVSKQGKNELREWPNWRDTAPDKAIEHVRGHHD